MPPLPFTRPPRTPTTLRRVNIHISEKFHRLTSLQALRILSLLEDHHRKLAGLIKEAPRKREKKEDDAASPPPELSTTSPPSKGSAVRTASPSTSSPTRAPSRRRLPQSSIASNLAEKRGIPGPRRSTPTSTPVSVTGALATRNDRPSTPVRDMLERQSRKAEAGRQSESTRPTRREEKEALAGQGATSPTEDNFRRFYSAFGGMIQAISAPLAFTSLPLSGPAPPAPAADQPPQKEEKAPKAKSRNQSPEASRTVKSSEPDIAALISKPALRALREDNTAPLGPFANNESFYLVPTSGGTVSYANILQNPNAPHHPHHAAQNPHLDSIDEGDNENGSGLGLKGSSHEEFVDARETVGPPSPTTSRRPRSQSKTKAGVSSAKTIAAGRGTGLKTMEEINVENEILKKTVDDQAKRLLMWETTSQSSYNALAQSFRARKTLSDPNAMAQALAMGANTVPPALPSPPIAAPSFPTTPSAQQQPDPEMAKRIAELEAQLANQSAQINELTSSNDQLNKQNEKNTLVLGRYREQWEKLKAGARRKEQERRERKLAEIQASDAPGKEAASKTEDEGVEEETEEVIEEDQPSFGKA